MPTLKWATGFEVGPAGGLTTGNVGNKFADLTGGTPTVITTTPRNGTYCLEINPTAAVEYMAWSSNTFGTTTLLVVGVAFRFPGALPSNDCVIVYCQNNAATDSIVMFRNSDDKIIVSEDGGANAVAGPVLAADTWYWLDLRYNVASAVHVIDWALNGTGQTQFNSTTLIAGQVIGLGLGDMFNAMTSNIRFDDCLGSVTTGDYPLGDHKVVGLKADTGGTTAEIGTANATARFTSNGVSLDTTHNSANILAALSELPPVLGGSASGVYQRTSGATNAVGIPMTTYTLAGGETISGVRILVCGWSLTTTANNVGMRTFNGTTESILFAAADPNFDNSTTAPGWLCKMAVNGDFDTQSELDALVVRYGYSTDISPQPGAHAIYAEVAVKLGGAVVAGPNPQFLSQYGSFFSVVASFRRKNDRHSAGQVEGNLKQGRCIEASGRGRYRCRVGLRRRQGKGRASAAVQGPPRNRSYGGREPVR